MSEDPAAVAPAAPARRAPFAVVGDVLRGTLGALSLLGGLTWLLLNLHGPQVGVDVPMGLVFTTAGLILLMPHRLRLPRRWTTVVVAASALAGTAAGSAATSSGVCCMFAYHVARGYPIHWLRRAAEADDPDTARRLAEASDWHVDLLGLVPDLFFWGCVGLLGVAAVVAVRRAVRARVGARP